jgi:hypothetical protein
MTFNLGGSGFVIAIVAICYAGWLISSWIRAKHGYPLEGEFGGSVDKSNPEADRKFELLSNENGRLTSQMARLEERIAVLERIATDKPTRLLAEIDSLK